MSNSEQDYLFVYGTLRRTIGIQVYCVLTYSAIFLGNGIFRGKLYDLGYYPGAVPSEKDTDKIKGDIYILPAPEKMNILDILDKFEGCVASLPSPAEFYRDKAMVSLENGKKIEAWIYLYNRPTDGLKAIPSGDYRER